jgi:hypothetical protein
MQGLGGRIREARYKVQYLKVTFKGQGLRSGQRLSR